MNLANRTKARGSRKFPTAVTYENQACSKKVKMKYNLPNRPDVHIQINTWLGLTASKVLPLFVTSILQQVHVWCVRRSCWRTEIYNFLRD